MSGDVQPRKRKDKKRKKDELGVEEARGTSAVFGEGDVFLHSHHDHGTGGHWCAKIIFFSLLAVLVTLIGLIILENRGLSELEANSIASPYSGVLDGWLEDAAADHHDEHTLDLKHHEEAEEDEEEDENEIEVEKIEKEVDSEATLYYDSFIQPNSNDIEDKEHSSEENQNLEDEQHDVEDTKTYDDDEDEQDDEESEDESSEQYEQINEEPPIVEHITAPSGKPFRELDEEFHIQHPADSLVEEEEYEKQQEELRQQEEQSSHKDGGNNINNDWPGEPDEQYWRQELNDAEHDLLQDWLN